MIRVAKVSKRFGGLQALHDLSFRVEPGEVVGFVGPNGAGKTTTLRILTGFIEADEGEVEVAGFDMRTQGAMARACLGYMPERTPLCEDMRVEEFLRYRAHLKGVPRTKVGEAIEREVERMELGEVRRRLIGKLSRGFRQRVALADAIIADPKVLLLDEPTTGLDPLQRRSFRSLLATLSEGRAVLFSSHVLPEVQAVVSRLLVIDHGKLVADGDWATLRQQASLPDEASAEEVFASLVEGAAP